MTAVINELDANRPNDETRAFSIGDVFQMLGSLKLTVTLFALSLVLVLVGTLAQDDLNMLEVKQRYFLTWIAKLHVDDFFPQAFYPHSEPFSLVLPFPGGSLIGVLLMANLVAAKATRFRVHSKGGKLLTGIGFLLLGFATAAFIIWAGNSNDGLQGEPGIGYGPLWALTLTGIALTGMGLGYGANKAINPTVRSVGYTIAAMIGIFVLYALVSGFRIGDPGLRIVWQLAKGLGAGVVLMVGCQLVFDKQGGNVLLHLGVGLLMFGQFVFGDRQLEQRLSLAEGESTNTLVNLDRVELAFIDIGENQDEVIAVPGSRLLAAAGSNSVIQDGSLPVDLKVVSYFENSTLDDIKGSNPATAGLGLETMAIPRDKSGGAEAESNFSSAYVELLEKGTDKSLGVHLVSQFLSDREMLVPDGTVENLYDEIEVNEKTYNIGMRFHREVKPYWVQLEDVRRSTYSGTETPRDFRSIIRIINEEEGDDLKEHVWMNNPLRYRGETFYQSNYSSLPNGKEVTGIQVVRNSGWLIPYVACSITALGMLVHFLGTLTRFVKRRDRETKKERAELAEFGIKPPSRLPVVGTVAFFTAVSVISLVPWSAVMNNMRPTQRAEKFDLYAAGKVPTQFGGRMMPLDSFARQTVKAMSNKESLPLENAPAGIKSRSESKRKLSAMQWLMEVATDKKELRFMPMFRIDASEVLSELGLERRKSKLYSLDDIGKQWSRVSQIIESAAKKDAKEMSFKERKLVELDRRTRQYTLTAASFQLPIPEEIPMDELQKVIPGADESMRQELMLRQLQRRMDALGKMSSPAIIAPGEAEVSASVGDPRWAAFAPAFFKYYSELAVSEGADETGTPTGVESFGDMIKAYSDNDPVAFNAAVDDHLASVGQREIPGFAANMIGLERWMQATWPTGVAMFVYLSALVMGLVYFFFGFAQLRRAVWGTLALAIVIHTVAILCRITITGRAPVINLYSSAVFIGWASVLFGLVVERIFKYGMGNVLSAASGVLTLLVAYGLNSGDTMPVLQAVLDTQFWLATHVISVTLGYVATLVAGAFGIGYLISNWLGRDEKFLRDVYRCCYGAACFGILFSFVGTVLGGLWADDSWGRFWGWDPKENGALLIVIWNALMLHARWDGMVKGRGFSLLAIGGNIVTAWSWFGTNELGIGLHSYGFTTGVLWWLSMFVLSQLAVISIDTLMRFVRPSTKMAA